MEIYHEISMRLSSNGTNNVHWFIGKTLEKKKQQKKRKQEINSTKLIKLTNSTPGLLSNCFLGFLIEDLIENEIPLDFNLQPFLETSRNTCVA